MVPTIKLSPSRLLTHSEGIFDFSDLPPSAEFSVKITGPIARTYWTTLKSDENGTSQLIWRTQAAGLYRMLARGEGFVEIFPFEVDYQAGEEDLIAKEVVREDRSLKTVEEPQEE